MPNSNDKLTDIPMIIPQRDDDSVYRRPRADADQKRKPARTAKPSGADTNGPGGGAWRVVAVLGLLVAVGTAGVAALLYQESVKLSTNLDQANQRIADLEGRLSSTDDSVNQSSAQMGVKLKELAAEVDKLWASAWRKNSGRLDAIDADMKKMSGSQENNRRQIATLDAQTDKLSKQAAATQEVGISVAGLREQQANFDGTLSRVSSTVNSMANTQRAQEARLKETEQWVKSNNEFRKQINQRLTKLENPASDLPQ